MITHARIAPEGISLTSDLQYAVPVEYVDQAAPDVVLHTHVFVLPLDATVEALVTRAKEYGRTVREAFTRLAGARAALPGGTASTPVDG